MQASGDVLLTRSRLWRPRLRTRTLSSKSCKDQGEDSIPAITSVGSNTDNKISEHMCSQPVLFNMTQLQTLGKNVASRPMPIQRTSSFALKTCKDQGQGQHASKCRIYAMAILSPYVCPSRVVIRCCWSRNGVAEDDGICQASDSVDLSASSSVQCRYNSVIGIPSCHQHIIAHTAMHIFIRSVA